MSEQLSLEERVKSLESLVELIPAFTESLKKSSNSNMIALHAVATRLNELSENNVTTLQLIYDNPAFCDAESRPKIKAILTQALNKLDQTAAELESIKAKLNPPSTGNSPSDGN